MSKFAFDPKFNLDSRCLNIKEPGFLQNFCNKTMGQCLYMALCATDRYVCVYDKDNNELVWVINHDTDAEYYETVRVGVALGIEVICVPQHNLNWLPK